MFLDSDARTSFWVENFQNFQKWFTLQFIIFTLLVFTFFSGPHVGRPTASTKSFDIASNSILSDGPTG